MKKLNLIGAIVCALILFSANSVKAQEASGQHVFSLGTGFSITGGIIKALDGDISDLDLDTLSGTTYSGSFTSNGGPQIFLGYDIGLSRRFSLGAIVSTQGFSGSAAYTATDDMNVTTNETVSFNLRRSNFSLTPKLHYGNEDRVDLYSGLRIGYVMWNSSIESSDPDFDALGDFTGGRPNFSIIVFGGKAYFNDNLGANFEFALGAPYLFGCGLSYRL